VTAGFFVLVDGGFGAAPLEQAFRIDAAPSTFL
jgi:hypothetical protein